MQGHGSQSSAASAEPDTASKRAESVHILHSLVRAEVLTVCSKQSWAGCTLKHDDQHRVSSLVKLVLMHPIHLCLSSYSFNMSCCSPVCR